MGVADLPCSLAKPKVEESNTICIEKALKRYLTKENTRPKKKINHIDRVIFTY